MRHYILLVLFLNCNELLMVTHKYSRRRILESQLVYFKSSEIYSSAKVGIVQ